MYENYIVDTLSDSGLITWNCNFYWTFNIWFCKDDFKHLCVFGQSFYHRDPHWYHRKILARVVSIAVQSVAVRRATGNDDSGPLFSPLFFWHERQRCSRLPLGGRLATTIVDGYFHHYFLFFPIFFHFFHFFFSVATFSHRRSARIKKLI